MKRPTRRRARYNVEQLPLLGAEDFTYIGSCRVPSTDPNTNAWCYVSDRGGLAFDPTTGHLWAHDGYTVFEMTIPDLVQSSDPKQLPVGSYVQPGFDPSEGRLYQDMGTADSKLGGLMRFNDKVIVAAYWYFDSAGAAKKSHFLHSVNGATASYGGMDKVWNDPKAPGWVSKYMAPVPPEWQAPLGCVAVTGGASLPIQSRESFGFSIFGFNPADINVVPEPVPAVMLQGQPGDHQTWGAYNAQSDMWNGNAFVNNVVLIPKTRTAIYCGSHGTGPFCYGSPGVECTDPERPAHGYHSYPYRYQNWLIDMAEWAEVRAGYRQPWDVLPYAYYPVTYPTPSKGHWVIGSAYDPTDNVLYVMQSSVCGYDNSEPVVHGYRVNVPDGPDPPDPPTPDSSLDTATVSQLFHELGERFAVPPARRLTRRPCG